MDFIRGEKLGHGSFATVNLAIPVTQNQPLMAVKSCGVSHSSSLMHEKSILEELKNCPEIITCYGETFSCENGERIYNLLLEYAPGGALSENSTLPESKIRRYTKSLLRGLNYIHKLGYVHCDIKLQNILLSENGKVKIADFGLARLAGKVSGGELRGTPMYMSPEMVAGGEQGFPADVWAVGCAVAEMVAGAPAWREADVAALLMRIGVGEEVPEVPAELSADGKDFLGKIFVKDPRDRWTAEMLLDHPFVCGLNDDEFREENEMSISPRCPFDFPEWAVDTCFITPLPSPEHSPARFSGESDLRRGIQGVLSGEGPDWSVTDDWVTVR